jgi:tetratricopeptide (TPR) repeat protein
MEFVRFLFIAGVKALGLLFLALLVIKAAAELKRPRALRAVFHAATWMLVILGALTLGYDVAAENFHRASARDVAAKDLDHALANVQRAIELRPGKLAYWQMLSGIKFAQKQYASALADEPVLRSLGGGKLEEADAYRLAVCHYLLGEYDRVHPLTQTLVRDNPAYAAPRVLEGYALLAERRFDESSRVFLEVLKTYPTQQSAVEGLAHAQYLSGNWSSALSVLDQTARYPFPPEARRRFEALKGLYGRH